MKNIKKFDSFNDFWPFYLSEHQSLVSRGLHYLGTVASHLLLLFFLWESKWGLIFLIPIIGYVPAWIGHYFIEKNHPATLTYPFWSLRGDYKMLWLAATGQLKQDLNKMAKSSILNNKPNH